MQRFGTHPAWGRWGEEVACKKPSLAKQPPVGTPMGRQSPACPQPGARAVPKVSPARGQGCAQGEEWDVGHGTAQQVTPILPHSASSQEASWGICWDVFPFFFFFLLLFACVFMLLGPGLPAQLLLVRGQLEGSAERGPRALGAHSALASRGGSALRGGMSRAPAPAASGPAGGGWHGHSHHLSTARPSAPCRFLSL